jgi:hypothetical protein
MLSCLVADTEEEKAFSLFLSLEILAAMERAAAGGISLTCYTTTAGEALGKWRDETKSRQRSQVISIFCAPTDG